MGDNPVVPCFRSFEEIFDVVFFVGEERCPAHRIVLSAASPMLRTMLYNSGMKECKQREVELRNFRADTWKAVLDFIYCHDVHFSDATQGIELLECAVFYQLDNMVELLLQGIIPLIHRSNYCKILMCAGQLPFRESMNLLCWTSRLCRRYWHAIRS